MELQIARKFVEDRDQFIDDLIEMIKKYSNEPMNSDFVEGLSMLPDDIIISLYENYHKKLVEIQTRQNSTIGIQRRRLD